MVKHGESQVIYFSNQGFTRAVRNISKIEATGARSMGCWNCLIWWHVIRTLNIWQYWIEGGNRTCSIMFHQLQGSASINSMSTFNILLKFYKVSSRVSNLAAWTSGKNITWDRRKSTSSKKLKHRMLCRSLSIQTPCTHLYRPICAFFLSKIPIVLQL